MPCRPANEAGPPSDLGPEATRLSSPGHAEGANGVDALVR